MSKWQAPAPAGEPTHSSKIRIKGVDAGSPEYTVLLNMLYGQIGQFQQSQQQQVNLSGQHQYKTTLSLPDAQITYQNNNGQETLWVEVSPQLIEQARREPEKVPRYPPIYEYELGGYIFFEIDHSIGDIDNTTGELIPSVPVTWVMSVNDVPVTSGSFTNERDSTYWTAVLFGSSALTYHSHRDSANRVVEDGKFVAFPSPKRKTSQPEYDQQGNPASGDLPEYFIFRVPGGVLGERDMTLWDGVMTPLILDGDGGPNDSRVIGGGVTRYTLAQSPLNLNGLNKITIDISAPDGVDASGYIMGEFFSRELREVRKTWRFPAIDGQKAFLNDRGSYWFVPFTNQSALNTSASQLPYGNFYYPYNSVPGTISGSRMVADSPDNYTEDDPVMVRELILDLRK